MLNYEREPVSPETKRRERKQAGEEATALEEEAAWLEGMRNLGNLLDDAGHCSREEQERHAEIYNARKREPQFEVEDRVWKKNRPLKE